MDRYYFSTNGLCNQEAIVLRTNYRISILTPSLLRLEYSETGDFEDRATQSVINRNFSVPPFSVQRNTNGLLIETEKLKLFYDENRFSENGLWIEVKEIEGAIWHYGQTLHDLKGTYRTLDRCDADIYTSREWVQEKIELGAGIVSREGFSVIDDSKSMALTEDGWVAPRKQEIDMYFFGYGHRYREALSDFYHLCGKTPLLPRYVFGNWWSRYYKYTEESYMALMKRFEAEKLPFSVAVIDIDWHLGNDEVDAKYGGEKRGWTGYTWNRKLFPDPQRLLAWLHNKNMKVTLNVHPADGVRDFEEIYPKMAEAMGIDPASEKPVEFDASDPHFMRIYFDILCHDLEAYGVDFWWIDWQQGTNSKLDGLDPLWILNHFHYLDSAWKGTRPLTFSRYAGVGSHRYPIGFSGDTTITWKSLDYQPYFTNTASNIGYGWWSHDIGGHMWGERDDELAARWVQYGVFSPINRLHSAKNPFSGKEPWRYGAEARAVMNRYLRLRHAMIPYLYTMNRRASRKDLPLIQPMYYAEPEREEAYCVPNEYYFGTELLVSPITCKTDPVSRLAKATTWLPEGQWCDMFTGTVYRGGIMADMWRPIENIPVFMKAGAIVPMTDMSEYSNSVDNPKAFDILVFPASDGDFILWEDSGDTSEDKDENWAYTEFAYRDSVFTIDKAKGNLSVIPERRSWNIVFCSVENSPVTVTVDGHITEVFCNYDSIRNRLTVTVPETTVDQNITVSLEWVSVADNRRQRCYEILERAQMSYDVKNDMWESISNECTEMLSNLDAAPSVIEALRELL